MKKPQDQGVPEGRVLGNALTSPGPVDGASSVGSMGDSESSLASESTSRDVDAVPVEQWNGDQLHFALIDQINSDDDENEDDIYILSNYSVLLKRAGSIAWDSRASEILKDAVERILTVARQKFQANYTVLMPFNIEGKHWVLLKISSKNSRLTVDYFDSAQNNSSISAPVLAFLKSLPTFKGAKFNPMTGQGVDRPDYDCGRCVLGQQLVWLSDLRVPLTRHGQIYANEFLKKVQAAQVASRNSPSASPRVLSVGGAAAARAPIGGASGVSISALPSHFASKKPTATVPIATEWTDLTASLKRVAEQVDREYREVAIEHTFRRFVQSQSTEHRDSQVLFSSIVARMEGAWHRLSGSRSKKDYEAFASALSHLPLTFKQDFDQYEAKLSDIPRVKAFLSASNAWKEQREFELGVQKLTRLLANKPIKKGDMPAIFDECSLVSARAVILKKWFKYDQIKTAYFDWLVDELKEKSGEAPAQ